MSNIKIDTADLEATIKATMTLYGTQGTEAIKRATKKTAQETAKAANDSAARRLKGKRHKYEKSWKSKVEEHWASSEAVVYSTQPGLPHLLEEGHDITYLGGNKGKGPGRSPAIPHLQQVSEAVPDMFMENIEKEVNKIDVS